ncbi:MAG: glycosyltransferase [Candidatus Diapherotrites archaeon]|nr:glycosyltransferase [Candidatus Diapherotrites archaeon]
MAKVVLISPVKPFRGGIAHSGTILAERLAEKNDLLVLSFSRLYPKFLYPGKFQKESGKPPKGINAEFSLDSVNPFSWAKAVRRIKEFGPDVVVFEWWTTFLAPCYSYIAGRVRPARVSVVCQNVLPHEGSGIHSFLAKSFLSRADSFVALARSDEKILKSIVPKAKAKTIIEPTYESVTGRKAVPKKEARKRLGIKEKNAILFFGFVRPYKGLEFLLRAMPSVRKDIILMIVGEFWEPREKFEALARELGLEKRVRIVDRYVSDSETALYFGAADCVVLPYTSGTEKRKRRSWGNFDA